MAKGYEGRSKGLLPDTKWRLDTLAFRLTHPKDFVGASTTNLPSPVDWNVGYSDQHDESSCTGHGNEKMLYGTAKANGYQGERGDEHSIYALRAIDYPEIPWHQPLPDEGASPASIITGLINYGCLARGFGPKTSTDRLDFLQLEAADGFKLFRVANLMQSGEQLIQALLQGLVRGCASFCMEVDAGYEGLTSGSVWGGPSGPSLGGHCQAVDAWRQGTNGVEIGVEGSWGENFGRIWIPADIFAKVASSVYVGQVVPRLANTPGVA